MNPKAQHYYDQIQASLDDDALESSEVFEGLVDQAFEELSDEDLLQVEDMVVTKIIERW